MYWPAQTWPVTYVHDNETTAASSGWATIYRAATPAHTRGSLGFEAPGRLDPPGGASCRHARVLPPRLSGVLLVGLRPSRGISRRVERLPKWTGETGGEVPRGGYMASDSGATPTGRDTHDGGSGEAVLGFEVQR